MRLGPFIQQRPAIASFALGALHALLFWLSFPPVFVWPLAFVSLWPLLWIVWKTPRPARSALMVGIAALPMWLLHHGWMIDVTAAGLPVLGLYLSLYAFLFVWLGARWRLRVGEGWKFWCALPVLWIGLEMLRGAVVWGGYPWYLLGHPTIDATGWTASTIGAYGASFLVALFSIRLFEVLFAERTRRARELALVLLGGAIVVLLGLTRSSQVIEGRTIGISVIQTNVPQDNRMAWTFDQKVEDFRRFAAMTQGAKPSHLIVWPETMFPGLSLNADAIRAERESGIVYPGGVPTTEFHDALLTLQSSVGTPMLVGAIAREGLRIDVDDDGRVSVDMDASYNSAFIVQNGEVEPTRYDKLHLTPFGEIMPLISRWDWLEEKLLALGAAGMSFELEAGRVPTVLTITRSDELHMFQERYATPICFEATMPGVCRRLVFGGGERRADVLINLTNDGWFGSSVGGRENHLLAARWRCVELRTPMVRAANTGISSFIESNGSVIARAPVNEEAVLTHGVALPSGATLYARLGDLPGWLCLAATVVIAGLSIAPRRTPGDPGRSVDRAAPQPT